MEKIYRARCEMHCTMCTETLEIARVQKIFKKLQSPSYKRSLAE